MCNAICEVCKRWRDVARLAWPTRQCIRIHHKNMKLTGKEILTRGLTRRTYFTSSSKHVLTNFITSKHIGRALTLLDLSGYLLPLDTSCVERRLSLIALAQHCPNLEHLDLRQIILYYFTYIQTQKRLI